MAETLPSLKAAPLPFLLAVSSGPDSMTMADLFHHCALKPGFAIAHCNFHLRGADADADEALLRRWTAERGIRLYVADFDTLAYAAEHSLSVEMAARELRYRWFAKLCAEHGHQVLAVAHNANDNAETLFLNILRGTGADGLAGMTLWDNLPYDCNATGKLSTINPRLFRPLLKFTRDQIEGYCYAHKLETRLDKTNLETDYKRNKIRNLVFPIFEQINPSFVKTIAREMDYFAQLKSIADDWFVQETSDLNPLNIDLVALLSKKNWEYILYRLLEPSGFNSAVIASIQKLLTDKDTTISGKTFKSPTHILYTTSSALVIQPHSSLDKSTSLGEPIMVLRGEGKYYFNGQHIEVEVRPLTSDVKLRQPEGNILFDADKLRFPIVARRWTRGDWFIPFGMKGKKKVSDYFVDRKYTLPQKERAIMLVRPDVNKEYSENDCAEGSHIMAVLGSRIDDSVKVTPDTKTVILIKIL